MRQSLDIQLEAKAGLPIAGWWQQAEDKSSSFLKLLNEAH
jgi:hypothetical protein